MPDIKRLISESQDIIGEISTLTTRLHALGKDIQHLALNNSDTALLLSARKLSRLAGAMLNGIGRLGKLNLDSVIVPDYVQTNDDKENWIHARRVAEFRGHTNDEIVIRKIWEKLTSSV